MFPFKTVVSECYNEWISVKVIRVTEKRNLKSPHCKVIVEQVLQTRSYHNGQIVRKSFKAGSLNLAVASSEDYLILCLKKEQLYYAGLNVFHFLLDIVREECRNPFNFIPDTGNIATASPEQQFIGGDDDKGELANIEIY